MKKLSVGDIWSEELLDEFACVWGSNKINSGIDRRAGELGVEGVPATSLAPSFWYTTYYWVLWRAGRTTPLHLTKSVFLTLGTKQGGSLKGVSFIFLLSLCCDSVCVAVLVQALTSSYGTSHWHFHWRNTYTSFFFNINMLISYSKVKTKGWRVPFSYISSFI